MLNILKYLSPISKEDKELQLEILEKEKINYVKILKQLYTRINELDFHIWLAKKELILFGDISKEEKERIRREIHSQLFLRWEVTRYKLSELASK